MYRHIGEKCGLGGAVQEAIAGKKTIALVSHRIFAKDCQATKGAIGGSGQALRKETLSRPGLDQQGEGAGERVHSADAVLPLRLTGSRGCAHL